MNQELKGYIKFILQNHIESIVFLYIDYLRMNKECDIRKINDQELELSRYYKKYIGTYLISIVSNRINEEIQRKINYWKNSELTSPVSYQPVYASHLYDSYSNLNKVIGLYINQYTKDKRRRNYILTELEILNELIDKNLLCINKDINYTNTKNFVNLAYLN